MGGPAQHGGGAGGGGIQHQQAGQAGVPRDGRDGDTLNNLILLPLVLIQLTPPPSAGFSFVQPSTFPHASLPRQSRRVPKALDLRVPGSVAVVAITGPNTGGKTVTLKTAGLAALMAKAGLYVALGAPPSSVRRHTRARTHTHTCTHTHMHTHAHACSCAC